MKKYIKPKMEVTTIEMEEMIAMSSVKGTYIDDLDVSQDEYYQGGIVDGKERNDWSGLLW